MIYLLVTTQAQVDFNDKITKVMQGQNALRYLARYVFRVAISNNRIKRIENNSITFMYKNREKKKWKKVFTACTSQRIYENQALWISSSQQHTVY